MEQTTTYRYEAKSDSSYNELAAYAINLAANVSLFPAHKTIAIEGLSDDVTKFIKHNNLDFYIAPIEVSEENFGVLIDTETTDPGSLRRIANCLVNRMVEMGEQHNDILAETIKERDRAREAGGKVGAD